MTLTTRLSVFVLAMLGIVLVGFSLRYLLDQRTVPAPTGGRATGRHVEHALGCGRRHSAGGRVGTRAAIAMSTENPLGFRSSGSWPMHKAASWIAPRNRKRPNSCSCGRPMLRTRVFRRTCWPPRPAIGNFAKLGFARVINHRLQPRREIPTRKGKRYSEVVINVGTSLAPLQATLTRLAMTLAGLSAVILLAALVAVRRVCRHVLSPVRRMAVAASGIGAEGSGPPAADN